MSRIEEVLRYIRRSRRLKISLLLAPPIIFLAIWFYAPFLILGLYSFNMINIYREIVFTPSLEHYTRVLSWTGAINIYLRSLYFAGLTVILCLLIGYPAAYYISFKMKKYKDVFIILFIIPFWVSFLLRTYAMMNLLDERGLLNTMLMSLGAINTPLKIMYTDVAVILVMVYDYLVMMVLPLYANLEKLDRTLLEAASTLGAGPIRTFIKVTLPLSMPGIMAGFLLVFIPAVGEFVVPELVGGPNNYMVGNIIYEIFMGARHWWIGSAFSMLFIAFILSLVIVYIRKIGERGLAL
ncbi:MAG: ABC transporter permease [Aigarchaeota archaeon]|nr:ABC transporter permease [Aigarchaeota archaeon]MCX8193575.1 ABC transporter permease [Nitrososphaeria archaeon]MDW7986550.1 ABC transporter permease [Nitrososphaerota archaeon]